MRIDVEMTVQGGLHDAVTTTSALWLLDAKSHAASRKEVAADVAAVPCRLLDANSCAACRVLRSQSEIVAAEASDLQQQVQDAQCTNKEAEGSLEVLLTRVAVLRSERACLEQRCLTVERALGLQTAAFDEDAARWRDEVRSWQGLCADARTADDDARSRATDFDQQRAQAAQEAAELRCKIEAARHEVSEFYSLQSGLEAQRLQDASRLSQEVQHFVNTEAMANAAAALTSTEAEAIEEQLAQRQAEAAQEQAELIAEQDHCVALECQLLAVHQSLQFLRSECEEERSHCSQAVSNLHAVEQAAEQFHNASFEYTSTPMRLDVPDNGALTDLAEQVEARAHRARELEAESERIRCQRREETERCRDHVERLRAKVRHYRARCAELRKLASSA